ncbi:hypothetical protein GCM10008018_71830 [Paenibacillus marchantiophytorum]|uniref:Transmembrane protein n=1 Tax=Paenibacillus marchantiophytorum TaxID=1619310 RepID=A0ABQ1FIU1_9BACL|nr:hypothetical protein GCM10008018_71830 [Paenibacillus marchantiophytorum]
MLEIQLLEFVKISNLLVFDYIRAFEFVRAEFVRGRDCWLLLGAGCWVWMLGARCWVLGSGFWVLGSGFWVLARLE